MKQITHKNHYVPQFYLKNWCNSDDKVSTFSILVSNKNVPLWEPKPVSSIAFFYDFYTQENDDEQLDDFEKWFSTNFEIPAKAVIDKVDR